MIVYLCFLAGYGQVCDGRMIGWKLNVMRGPSECHWLVPGTEADDQWSW